MKIRSKFLHLFPVFLFLLFSVSTVSAEGKADHYLGKLRRWLPGIYTVDTYSGDRSLAVLTESDLKRIIGGAVGVATEDEDSSVGSIFVNEKGKSGYLLVLTSQLQEFSLEEVESIFSSQDVILICDSLFNFGDNFDCGYDSLTGASSTDIVLSGDTGVFGNAKLVSVSFGGKRVIVIPEVNLVSPSLSQSVERYLKVLHKGPQSGDDTSGGIVNAALTGFGRLDESLLADLSGYALLLFIILLVFQRPFESLVRDWRVFLKRETYIRAANVAKSFLTRYRWISLYFLMIALVFYIPLIFSISFRDKGDLDIQYIIGYSLDTLSLGNFSLFIEEGSFFRVALLLYYLVFALLGTLVLLPDALRFFERSFKVVFSKRMNQRAARYVLAGMLLVSILLLAALGFQTTYLLVALSLLLCFYLILSLQKSFGTANLYTRKERIFVGLVLTLFVSAGMLYRALGGGSSTNVRLEGLVRNSKEFVVLPYSREYGEYTEFRDFFLRPDYPVFVDDYLVFHPAYPRIANLDITEYEPGLGSFIILDGGVRELTKFVLTQRPGFLQAREVTGLFMVSGAQIRPDLEYSLALDIDCSSEVKKTTISLNIYTSEDQVGVQGGDMSVKKERMPVLEFPGCFVPQDSEKMNPEVIETSDTYRVPVDLSDLVGKDMVVEIDGMDSSKIEGVRVYVGDQPLSVRFLVHNSKSGVLYRNLVGGTLRVYSFGLPESLEVQNNFGEEFNLGGMVEAMREGEILDNPFTIWTTNL